MEYGMTLKNSGKLKAFICDGENCAFQWSIRFHPSEIAPHAKKMREDGWITIKIGNKYQHFCPRCEPPQQKNHNYKSLPWRADIDG
jgi:hypothetical protein